MNICFRFGKKGQNVGIKHLISLMNKDMLKNNLTHVNDFFGFSTKEECCIFNENKTIVLLFNGSIFKYQTLKNKLVKLGHNFLTACNMEVVLHAYEEYGVNCFKYIDGMFVIAIYDFVKRKLLLVRDRAGQNSCYYYKNNNVLLFSTELKSLLDTNLINKKINKNALWQYFRLRYIPAPNTIFKNIYKINPGHYIEIDEQGKMKVCAYWDLIYSNDSLILDYNKCKKLLREAVFSSVEDRMKNSMSPGAFLSGGIDSSIIVGIMSQLSSVPINTFTVGYNERVYNESKRAQSVADYYKTNHYECFLNPVNVQEPISEIINKLDEPFADMSAIPTYIISKYAKKYVDVVLTGDSADELFAGYSKYLENYYNELYKKIPLFLRKNIVERLVYLAPNDYSLVRKMRKVMENVNKDPFSRRKELMCLGFTEADLKVLLNGLADGEFSSFIRGYYDKYENLVDELVQVLYTDFKVVLEGDILFKVKKMTSLSFLEARVPFLSKDVMEIAARIPSQYKMSGSKQKIILKETFKDIIPVKNQNLSKKGFGIPLGKWFRGLLKEELLGLLNREYLVAQGLFNYEFINCLLDEHFTGKKDRASELWILYVFQHWYRRFFDIC